MVKLDPEKEYVEIIIQHSTYAVEKEVALKLLPLLMGNLFYTNYHTKEDKHKFTTADITIQSTPLTDKLGELDEQSRLLGGSIYDIFNTD